MATPGNAAIRASPNSQPRSGIHHVDRGRRKAGFPHLFQMRSVHPKPSGTAALRYGVHPPGMVTTWLLGMKLSPGGHEGMPAMGELLMGDVRYAVRVRGHSGDAVTVAGQRGPGRRH